MRRTSCPTCGHGLYPGNTACLRCGTEVVFDPAAGFLALTTDRPGCANRALIGCNRPAQAAGALCDDCRHTTVIPDLSREGAAAKWARLERAKRAVLLQVRDLGLPLADASGAPAPRFEFRADPPDETAPRVLTGHENGTITLNIAEADDVERARIRQQMNEPFRTLFGHFRHEIAHHYWDVLTAAEPGWTDRLRAAFGDERQDYAAALAAHYENGPPADWDETFISAYATAHPWEDFAETWAHVLHMLGGLETAQAYGLLEGTGAQDPAALLHHPMSRLAGDWVALTIALNAVNQAMGHETFYPFVLSPGVIDKMETIRGALLALAALRR
ncbi:zinc-binding metallopeptidase family protein [Celeribacter indicus]|uniref:Zinc-ribbon domain-containing protein n=1 Tax=Celeribacter indicus TaxID=1208324 RepID=A0A0B5DR32_9RHOB|nr:putative zinc-binding metallopeptidase [Celeribacter indicus]AJE45544.1 hypothetical protein P73_0829 [Celeribacter indicus]SDW86384.1 hypothetical protein SAMN05443573_108106 [Celeribacter indicus]